MTTTSHLQIRPDFYTNITECVEASKKQNKIIINPRYVNFNQDVFTAGDEEQFDMYRYPKNGSLSIPDIDLSRNLFREYDISKDFWEKNHNITAAAVIDTFRYIFYKLKKGIFVKILNNKLKVFLPFSHANFVNEWSHKINMTSEEIISFLKRCHNMEETRFHFAPYSVNDKNKWYANNCIIRREKPVWEGDSSVGNMKNMLEELCANRTVPDIEFFLNRRDFPLITKNGMEPYNHMWGANQPLVSHSYEKYAPILSMSKTDNYADVLIPTWEDWQRVQFQKGKFFLESCTKYEDSFSTTPWKDKISKAVFRGSTTGCGTTIETNMRLKACAMSVDHPEYLDCGITSWNFRPRKHENSDKLTTMEKSTFPFSIANRLTIQEQTEYKYFLNIEGHVAAFRLSYELSSGTLVLLVASKWKIWYQDMIKPYVHYVPVKADLSDLIEIIDWCREHDAECEQITKNARKFFDEYLNYDSLLDFYQKTLVEMKKYNGVYIYNATTPLDAQIAQEKQEMEVYVKKNNLDSVGIIFGNIPNIPRSYGKLRAIEMIIASEVLKGLIFQKDTTFSTIKMGNNKRIVYFSKIYGFNLVLKTILDKNEERNNTPNIHEAFIGTHVINKLLQYIPNFAYNFGIYKQESNLVVISEFIEGQTMKDYIESDDWNIQDFLFILLQIGLVLEVAQNLSSFVHWDLTMWNIMIHRLKFPTEYEYVIGPGNIYKIKTSVIPIFIDYGASHVIYKGEHYGLVHMFSVNTMQDIYTILVTSIWGILARKTRLTYFEIEKIKQLGKFISCIITSGEKLSELNDIKKYTFDAKKYIFRSQVKLNQIKPIHFVQYIMKNLGKFPVWRVTESNRKLHNVNSEQFLKYIYAKNIEQRRESFIFACKRIKNRAQGVDQIKMSPLMLYFTVQTLGKEVEILRHSMSKMLRENNKIFDETLEIIQQIYNTIPVPDNYGYSEILSQFQNICIEVKPKYTAETFLIPHKMLSLLEARENPCPDMSEYKELLFHILTYSGRFSVHPQNKELYMKTFKNLLDIDWNLLRTGHANRKTIVKLSNEIYPPTLGFLDDSFKDIDVYKKLAVFKQ